MASIHGAPQGNGHAISIMKDLPRPPPIKTLPPTPLLAEIPPTPDGVEAQDMLASRDLSAAADFPDSKVAPLSHIPFDASHRRSSSSSRSNINRSSLMPGRNSSENTAVSIFSMYTEETGLIHEAIAEHPSSFLTTFHPANGVARPQSSSPERPASSKRSWRSQESTEMSIGADTMAALLGMPAERASVPPQATHGPTRASLPDSIRLPYDEGLPTTLPASDPSATDAIRPMSRRSVNRPATAGSGLSVSRERTPSSIRTSVAMSPSPSSDLHSSVDNLSTSAALLPPLPPSRNSSRTSRLISGQLSGSSPRSSQSNLLPPTAFPTLAPDFLPKQRPSTSALTTLSQPRSHRGADEEADAEYVRSVYACFDVGGGVPGDGYEEGVERTRARLSSNVQHIETNGQPNAGDDINEKEQRRLRELDRYGFFMGTARQENRLTLLPAAPLSKKVKRLKSSAPHVSASQNATPPDIKSPPDKPPTNEIARLRKWYAMMRPVKKDPGGNTESWSPTGNGTSAATFRRRVWKGVPDRWRPAAWQMLIDDACERNRSRVTQTELERHYRENIDVPSKHDIQIDLDVPRTVNGHVLFHTRYGQGQRSLFHALHCFSLRCSECEYVQGMGPIVATLLFYFNAERAFANIARIHDEYGMHSIFRPGFPGLLEAIYIQERLVERIMPAVYKSFQKHMISSTSYVTKWYITLFANSFSFQIQLRIWDAFFLEGRDIIIIVAVAIIWVLKDYLSSPQANFETILSLLSSYFVVEDEDIFINWIRTTLESQEIRSAMMGWRQHWGDLVAQGRHHGALL